MKTETKLNTHKFEIDRRTIYHAIKVNGDFFTDAKFGYPLLFSNEELCDLKDVLHEFLHGVMKID